MLQLTAPQATLIVAIIATVGALLGWAGRAPTFLLHRWWTGAPRQEQAAYLNSVADLASKLRTHGMTLEEVRELEAIVRNPAVASSAGATRVVEAMADDTSEPEAFQSNVAMKARTGAAYTVADARLEQAIMDLRLLIGEHEFELLAAAQEKWRDYRRALEDCALREFEGGTHATLAMALAGLSETERRTDEIKAQVAERGGR